MIEAQVLQRVGDESWYEAALRIASRAGLERDVELTFVEERAHASSRTAAWRACLAWDLVDSIDDELAPPPAVSDAEVAALMDAQPQPPLYARGPGRYL